MKQDDAEAFKWVRKAAEGNYAPAQSRLGGRYYDGYAYAEAIKWWLKAAAQNDTRAQVGLGVCYSYGQGVKKDEAAAVSWYRKAAEQNYSQGQYNLGANYSIGAGVREDMKLAVYWWTKAAAQKNTDAQCALAFAYEFGQSVERNQAEAVRWWREAAELNDPRAQTELAFCYQQGSGLSAPLMVPLPSFSALSQTKQPTLNQKDRGIRIPDVPSLRTATQDEVEAVKWWHKAAELDYPTAQFSLGICYEYGRGANRNQVEAYAWYGLAVKAYEQAAIDRDALAKAMSEEQIAAAQSLTKDLAARIEVNLRTNLVRKSRAGEELRNPVWLAGVRKKFEAFRQTVLSEVTERARQEEFLRKQQEAADYLSKAKRDAKDSLDRKLFSIRLKRAEEGSAEAQFDLAVQFANGEGVPKDEAKARMWLEKAAAQGNAKAKKMLESHSAPSPSK